MNFNYPKFITLSFLAGVLTLGPIQGCKPSPQPKAKNSPNPTGTPFSGGNEDDEEKEDPRCSMDQYICDPAADLVAICLDQESEKDDDCNSTVWTRTLYDRILAAQQEANKPKQSSCSTEVMFVNTAVHPLNLRSEPSQESDATIILPIPRRHQVTCLALVEQGSWTKVKVNYLQQELEGYMYTSYLSPTQPAALPNTDAGGSPGGTVSQPPTSEGGSNATAGSNSTIMCRYWKAASEETKGLTVAWGRKCQSKEGDDFGWTQGFGLGDGSRKWFNCREDKIRMNDDGKYTCICTLFTRTVEEMSEDRCHQLNGTKI